MNVGEILRSALSEIRHHKLRSTLTLLGVILGTLSITVMTTFLDGIVGVVWAGFADLGYDGVMYVVARDARDLDFPLIAPPIFCHTLPSSIVREQKRELQSRRPKDEDHASRQPNQSQWSIPL